MNGTRKHPHCKFCGGLIPESLSTSARHCSKSCIYKAKSVREGRTLRVDPDVRFWNAVNKGSEDECWEWKSTTSHGYGVISLNGSRGGFTAAHRHSYEIANGPIPAGASILHSCDNRACVNPRHLRAGTHDDDMTDMAVRERSSKTKLTASEVMEIRRDYADGESQSSLASHFGVSKGNIAFITSGKTWKHLPLTGKRPQL